MTRLVRWIDACSRAGAYLSALSILLIVALVVVEIAARSLFGFSTMISDEYSGYLMVATVLLGLAHTLRTDSHIRITIVLGRLGPGPRRFLEQVVILGALALCGFVLYHSILLVHDSWSLGMQADTMSETPIFLPQLLIPVGLTALALQLTAQFLRRLPFFPNP